MAMAKTPSETLPKYLRRRSMEESESLEDFAPVRSVFSVGSEREAGSKSRLGREEAVGAVGGGGRGCSGDAALGGTWDAR